MDLFAKTFFRLTVWISFLASPLLEMQAQQGASIDLPKPEKYENRTLASERTGSGRINPFRRIQQNIVTHYNFYFNAANKLSEVILGAKSAQKEDYTKLLPIDNYTLEQTSAQKEELDSVILKCNNGILLHDLRNDWVDDLYLLMGIAYYHKKEFDSAAITFQYINYSFQPRTREELGYEKSIGSSINEAGNVYTISTPERKSALSSAITHQPARNDAVLWLLRSLIEQGQLNEASGLIETLRRDPTLPSRLANGLAESQARWFYRSEQWDSAAIYLEKSLPVLSGAEKARREYLTAQLYERAWLTEAADRLYGAAISHTTDPVMEAYARIQQIGLQQTAADSARIRKSLEKLQRMAGRTRYEDYRQIIHYAAYRLELQRKDTLAAVRQLQESIANGAADAALRARSFLSLGDLSFAQRNYLLAANSYDSIQTNLLDETDTLRVALRSAVVRKLATQMGTIRTQDSLLRIAALPEAERKVYVQKLSRTLRKAQGLQEEEAGTPTPSSANPLREEAPINLFAANEGKGDWYFYNGTLKVQGYRQFQAKWGKRPNLDNWRRNAAIEAQLNAMLKADPGDPDKAASPGLPAAYMPDIAPLDYSYDGLIAGLPLTDSLRQQAHATIQMALLNLGITFREELDMCQEATMQLTALLNQYPQTMLMEEALYHLCSCLRQSGDLTGYEFYRRQMASRFPKGRLLAQLENPQLLQQKQEEARKEAETRYEEIAALMIQGQFEEAMKKKQQADSGYGKKYWTSELQYIEALYLISERKDSLAELALASIREKDPSTPIARRASELAEVLKKRAEIEEYLTKLDVRRYPEDSLVLPAMPVAVQPQKAPVLDTTQSNKPPVPAPKPIDPSLPSPPAPTPPPSPETQAPRTSYLHQPAEPHAVIMVFQKVDVVYRTEARITLNKYHQSTLPDAGLTAESLSLTEDVKIIKVAPFDGLSAAWSYGKTVRDAASKELFPWMPTGTYQFLPVSLPNMELLLQKQDIQAYLSFLRQHLPGEF